MDIAAINNQYRKLQYWFAIWASVYAAIFLYAIFGNGNIHSGPFFIFLLVGIGFGVAFLFSLAALLKLIKRSAPFWICIGIILTPLIPMIAISSFVKELNQLNTIES